MRFQVYNPPAVLAPKETTFGITVEQGIGQTFDVKLVNPDTGESVYGGYLVQLFVKDNKLSIKFFKGVNQALVNTDFRGELRVDDNG